MKNLPILMENGRKKLKIKDQRKNVLNIAPRLSRLSSNNFLILIKRKVGFISQIYIIAIFAHAVA